MRPDDDELEGLPLFGPTATQVGLAALAATAAKNEAMIELLVPLARRLAREWGEVTVSDLRDEAERVGLLSGHEPGRTLSYLGAVMKRAGLRNTGTRRRSHKRVTHGIPQTIWAWPGLPPAGGD